jgi:membrane-associated protease RseP (regulator of RpoE activity)
MRDDGVVYSYSLNGTPAISFPNGIVSLLDNRDIQYLLDNFQSIEYARFAWLGIACRLEALTQPATLALAVEKVKPHSLAAFAGFLPQDKIVKLDNAPIACESKRFPVVAQPPTGNAAQPRVFTILRGQNETLSLNVPVMPPDTFAPVCLKKSGIVVQRAFPHGPAEGCAFEVMSLGPDCVIKGLHLGDVVLFDREVPADALEAELAKYPLRLLRGAIELTIGA